MSSVLDTALVPPRPLAYRLLAAALFALSYAGLVLFGQWLALSPGHTSSLVLTSGLYLAVLLSSDRHSWLKWAATVFAVECFVVMGIFRAPLKIA